MTVDLDRFIQQEARIMGRPCTLAGHSSLDVGGVRVETVVYVVYVVYVVCTVAPSGGPFGRAQHPYTTFVDGRSTFSGIAGFAGFGDE